MTAGALGATPVASVAELERRLRSARASLDWFALSRFFPKLHNAELRRTHHAREWFQLPMNYARILEVPLTLELLDARPGMRVMDISSPKLLALYLACTGYPDLIVSDLEQYFVADFRVFNKLFGLDMDIQVFDATRIPLPEASVDRVFSVSVIEHVPGAGDGQVVREVARVLRPGGLFVFTVPAGADYLEEWVRDPRQYWRSDSRTDGAVFYQRRYSLPVLRERLVDPTLVVDDIVGIAETPIRAPELGVNGMLLHNSHYLRDLRLSKAANFLAHLKLPLSRYAAQRMISARTHYLTRDFSDPNVRQLGVRMRKPSLSS